jgi:mannitol-specific phosphotransferase system IIBC component
MMLFRTDTLSLSGWYRGRAAIVITVLGGIHEIYFPYVLLASRFCHRSHRGVAPPARSDVQ